MNTKFFRTATTVSFINYHFVFCPKYRRKIFLIPNVETRFKELTQQICNKLGIQIIAMECHKDHVHMFLKKAAAFTLTYIHFLCHIQLRCQISSVQLTRQV